MDHGASPSSCQTSFFVYCYICFIDTYESGDAFRCAACRLLAGGALYLGVQCVHDTRDVI